MHNELLQRPSRPRIEVKASERRMVDVSNGGVVSIYLSRKLAEPLMEAV
jgi:hypothetical protein